MQRTYIRFSVATLGLVVAIMVGLLAGFRTGYDSAVAHVDSATVYVERYPVEDLVRAWGVTDGDKPGVDRDTLVELVRTTIFPEEWQRPRAIYLDASQLELVVTFQKAGHREITRLLEQLRALRVRYDQRATAGKCGHCGAGTLPEIGDRCPHCDRQRAAPTSQPPARTTAYR